MRKSLFYAAMLFATLLTACSSDDSENETIADGKYEIKIASSINDAVTRGVTQGNYINSGELIYVWGDVSNAIDETKDGTSWFNAWELTANGSNGFTHKTGDVKYYPGQNQNIDLFAIHGNQLHFTAGTTEFPTSVSHTIYTDQTTTDGYVKSDLLYGTLKKQAHSTSTIPVTFYHMLSKIEVVLKPGVGVRDADLTDISVNLLNVKPTVTFAPKKLTAEELATQGTRANLLTNTGNPTSVKFTPTKVEKATDGYGTQYSEVIIPPQSYNGTDFMSITFNSGGLAGTTLYYQLTKDLLSGYVYQFNILVSPTTFTLSPSVTLWESETTTRDKDMNKKS